MDSMICYHCFFRSKRISCSTANTLKRPYGIDSGASGMTVMFSLREFANIAALVLSAQCSDLNAHDKNCFRTYARSELPGAV